MARHRCTLSRRQINTFKHHLLLCRQAIVDEQDRVRPNQGIKAIAAPSMERWFSADFREREPATVARATEMLKQQTLKGMWDAVPLYAVWIIGPCFQRSMRQHCSSRDC